MGKRGYLLLVILLTLFMGFVSTVSAADVGYIVLSRSDPAVMEKLQSFNLTVDVIKDADVYTKNLGSYKFLVVGDDILRKSSTLQISRYPSIIMNKYYGVEWGLTDDDGISQLTSNRILQIKLPNDGVFDAYTQSKNGGSYLSYYFLDDENKVNNTQVLARTYAGTNYQFGDVVTEIEEGTRLMNGNLAGGNICFFGIASAKYWTPRSESLFDQCVGHVLNICTQDSDCDDNDPYTKDICTNPGTPDAQCEHQPIKCIQESDCGVDGFIGNNFCTLKNVSRIFADYTCVNPGETNSFCRMVNETRTITQCTYNCLDGSCVSQPSVNCSTDLECDDDNPRTADQCVNPGTSASFCRNTEMNCLNDLDCGTSGFIGTEFCSANDVFKQYQNASCRNPGTLDSFCVVDRTEKLVQDCDDGNPLTIDKCIENGVAKCEHTTLPSQCSTNSDCGVSFNSSNFCSQSNVVYNQTNPLCINGGCTSSTTTKIKEVCTYGCENGVCKPEPPVNITCTTNSECGTDGFIGSSFCSVNDAYQPYITYTCNNPGTIISSCSSNTENRLKQDCGEQSFIGNICVGKNVYSNYSNPGCANGACNSGYFSTLNQTCDYQCNNGACVPQPGEINCFSDSECGFTGFTGENFCSSNNVFKQYQNSTCLNPGTLDSFCRIVSSPKLLQECKDSNEYTFDTCEQNGIAKCVFKPIRCITNLDCNDNSPFTNDICVNPGSVDSFCRNIRTPSPMCYFEQDCGTDAFVGVNYCANGNVVRDFNDFTCNLPSPLSGYCSNSTTQKLIQECPNGCENGACKSLPPVNITCTTNSQCGTDGFIGNNFCTQNNVTQNFITYTCNNPGLSNSFCSSVTIGQTKQVCNTQTTSINFCQGNNLMTNKSVSGCLNGACSNQIQTIFNQTCVYGCDDGSCLPQPPINETLVHDVSLIDFSGSVNGIKLQYTNGSNLVSNTILCNEKYKVLIRAENKGNYTENITYEGSVGSVLVNHEQTLNLLPGEKTNEKTRTINFSLAEGLYDITINANIPNDDNLLDNTAKRQIQVLCPSLPQCTLDSQCGTTTIVNYCVGKDVYTNKTMPKCITGNCQTQITNNFNKTCDYQCSNGECVQPPIACNNNLECGTDGFVGNNFCTQNNVTQNFITYTCNNPGLSNSFCSNATSVKFKESCSGNVISTNFCIEDDLYTNITTPGCDNGECVVGLQTRLNQTCEFGCASGNCLPEPPLNCSVYDLNNDGDVNELDTDWLVACRQKIDSGDTNNVCKAKADLNKDGSVNVFDISKLTGEEMCFVPCNEAFDLNNDGKVDSLDTDWLVSCRQSIDGGNVNDICKQKADLNNDRSVNVFDIAVLKGVSCFIPSTPELSCTEDLGKNLVAYYKFDGNTNDALGRYNGTIVGQLGFDSGILNKGIEFNGFNSDDYVNLQNTENLNLQEDMTITAWVKLKEDPNKRKNTLISKWDESKGYTGPHPFEFYIDNSKTQSEEWWVFFGTYYEKLGLPRERVLEANDADLNEGQWYHVAVVQKRINSGEVNITVYVNGEPDTNNMPFNFEGSRITSDDTIKIGGLLYSEKFDGVVDELRIYDRALIDCEIEVLYNQSLEGDNSWSRYVPNHGNEEDEFIQKVEDKTSLYNSNNDVVDFPGYNGHNITRFVTYVYLDDEKRFLTGWDFDDNDDFAIYVDDLDSNGNIVSTTACGNYNNEGQKDCFLDLDNGWNRITMDIGERKEPMNNHVFVTYTRDLIKDHVDLMNSELIL